MWASAELPLTRDGALKGLFSFRLVVNDDVEARQAQVRLDALRIQLDGVIDFGERLLAFVAGRSRRCPAGCGLRRDSAPCAGSLSPGARLRRPARVPLGGSDVVVAKLDARVEIVFVEFGSLAQLFKCFLKTLQPFVSARQAPVSRGELLVDLDSVAKLERRFLKLLVSSGKPRPFRRGLFLLFQDWCSR